MIVLNRHALRNKRDLGQGGHAESSTLTGPISKRSAYAQLYIGCDLPFFWYHVLLIANPCEVTASGTGTVRPFGVGVGALWQAVSLGRSGSHMLTSLRDLDPESYPVRYAAGVRYTSHPARASWDL
jgi:hypothetical protein